MLDGLAAVWADPVIGWPLSRRDFQPLAYLVIAHPPEASDSSWAEVTAVVEVQSLLAGRNRQALQYVIGPHRERESP